MDIPKFNPGDIVVPHIPEKRCPYDDGYCWIDRMDQFAEKEWQIHSVSEDISTNDDRWVYEIYQAGHLYKYYDFWLTPASTVKIDIDEHDLSLLLEEGMS